MTGVIHNFYSFTIMLIKVSILLAHWVYYTEIISAAYYPINVYSGISLLAIKPKESSKERYFYPVFINLTGGKYD